MPVDPYTGAPLPYGPYDGPWPPDPSWDEPLLNSPPILPPPDAAPQLAVQPGEPTVTPQPAPEAAQARAAADELFAPTPGQPEVKLGMPRPVESVDPIDESLIELDEPDIDMSQLDTAPGPGAQIGDISLPLELDAVPEDQLRADENAAMEAEYGAKSTEQLALEQFDANQASQQDAAAKAYEALKVRHAEERRAEDTFRTAMAAHAEERAKVDAEAARLATEKVDPNGWRDSRNLFQKIAMYTAAIVGGMMQSSTGGVNRGLEMIDKEIQQHIAAQQQNLANRRALLGDRRAALGDQAAIAAEDRRTAEAFAQAAYMRAVQEVEADQAQYDPQGTAFRQREMFKRELAARGAQARAEAIKASEAEYVKAYEFGMKAEKHAAELAKTKAETAKLRGAGAGGGGAGSAAKLKQDPRVLAARYGVDPKLVEGLGPMTESEFSNVLENAWKSRRAMEPTKADEIAHDRLITGPGGPLANKDGRTDWVTGNPEETRVKLHAARKIVDLLDEADAIRARVGGESSWGNSDDFQRLDTLSKELLIARKAGTQGMSSDADMANLETAIGAKNLTSFRSQAARLKQARSMTVREINAWLTDHNYNGDALKFRNQYRAAGKTADEAMLGEIIGYDAKGQSVPTAAILSPVGAIARAGEAIFRDEDSTIPERYQRELDQWAEDAASEDAGARRAARNRLKQAAERGKSEVIRKAATAALNAARAVKMPKPGEKGFSVRKVQEAMEAELADENANEEED